MQWSFWTSWLLPLQSFGPGAAPVLGPGIWRQSSYLSMTFDAGGLRYTSLPQLTQNRMLLATSKLSSEVGEIFLIWEFYLWNYCRACGRQSISPCVHYSKCRPENISKKVLHSPYFVVADSLRFFLPFCRVLRTPQRKPWRPVSAEWSGWFVVFWASWDPSHHPPSPGLLCLSPAWCPTPHHHFSLQKETFFCIVNTSLNWLHPFTQWQSADKYIFALPYSRRFTHHKCKSKETHVFLILCY